MTTSIIISFSLPTLVYQILFLLVVLCSSHGSVASIPDQHSAIHSTPKVVPQEDEPPVYNLPGHLKPLGSHRPPEDPGVEVLHRVPDPLDFFNNYVTASKPVVFKGAAQNMAAYKLWTDTYLSEKYGHLEVEVEEGKKENRSNDLWLMPLSKFIQTYQEEDVYLVTDVPDEMSDEFCLLRCMLCGGFTESLTDTVVWYSSGGTKSVLHYDSVDNINCVMDGRKELFMVDKKEQASIDIDHPEQSFSGVDVDKVDMNRYPGLGQVPWYNVTLERGDCFFIPYKWFHAVRSWGRNLAVNVWFLHRRWFNDTDCSVDLSTLPEYVPLSSFKTRAGHFEILRSKIASFIDENNGLITSDEMQSIHLLQQSTKQQVTQLFESLDENGDQKLSITEVYSETFLEACEAVELNFNFEEEGEGEEDEGDEGEGEMEKNNIDEGERIKDETHSISRDEHQEL